MIRRSRSATIFILDLLILYACFLGAFVHYSGLMMIPLKGALLMLFIALVWFIVALNSSIATVNIESKIFSVLKDTLIGYSVLSVSVIVVVAVFGEFTPNNKLIVWPLLFAVILSSTLRLSYLIIIKCLARGGYQQKNVLLIGGDHVAERVMNEIISSAKLGYRLYGILADYYHHTMPQDFYLGKVERFSEIVRPGVVDEVIIALPLRKEKMIIDMVERCNSEGIRVRIVPDFFRIISNRPILYELGDIPLIGIRTEPLSLIKNRVLKRVFDIVFSSTILVLLFPLFLILALLIKLTSRGPVFFKQERIGDNNSNFKIHKFRTMSAQDKKESDTIWTTANDSRVTAIGKILRKKNLDELPQFWNVLIGNMSIVGPRPEREYFVEEFKKEIRHYKVRHLVKSGITGWAQVNGWRGDTSIKERVEHDIYYIENWSFWLDLRIIWLTVFDKEAQKHAY